MDFKINAALIVPLISWLSAQIIKLIIHAIKYRTFNPERLFGAGGMPSSHSSTVCSLAIIVSRIEGFDSTFFALSMILAMITMYDAMGVRRAAGLHAKQINRLRHIVDELDEEILDKIDEKLDEGPEGDDEDEEDDRKELKEYLGHTPIEVLCGALLGIIVAMAFPIDLLA